MASGDLIITVQVESLRRAIEELEYIRERIRQIFPFASSSQQDQVEEMFTDFLAAHTRIESLNPKT